MYIELSVPQHLHLKLSKTAPHLLVKKYLLYA